MSSEKSGNNANIQIQHLNQKANSGSQFNFSDLLMLMRILRDPNSGCPWDQKQTFASIAPYTIEEAYEVADAIERGNLSDLKDELGDLLLQVVYHSQIASESQEFEFGDVVHQITAKMLRRHPHVFANEKDQVDIRGLWDRIKAEEAAEKAKKQTIGETPCPASVLDGVPLALPALTRAVKIQKKAGKVGFDWPEALQIFEKIKEEISELETEIISGNQINTEEELGDLFFALANLSRHLKVDPEKALSAANYKFQIRFHYIEKKLGDDGRTPDDATLEEMDRLWNEAKLHLKQAKQDKA